MKKILNMTPSVTKHVEFGHISALITADLVHLRSSMVIRYPFLVKFSIFRFNFLGNPSALDYLHNHPGLRNQMDRADSPSNRAGDYSIPENA